MTLGLVCLLYALTQTLSLLTPSQKLQTSSLRSFSKQQNLQFLMAVPAKPPRPGGLLSWSAWCVLVAELTVRRISVKHTTKPTCPPPALRLSPFPRLRPTLGTRQPLRSIQNPSPVRFSPFFVPSLALLNLLRRPLPFPGVPQIRTLPPTTVPTSSPTSLRPLTSPVARSLVPSSRSSAPPLAHPVTTPLSVPPSP